MLSAAAYLSTLLSTSFSLATPFFPILSLSIYLDLPLPDAWPISLSLSHRCLGLAKMNLFIRRLSNGVGRDKGRTDLSRLAEY